MDEIHRKEGDNIMCVMELLTNARDYAQRQSDANTDETALWARMVEKINAAIDSCQGNEPADAHKEWKEWDGISHDRFDLKPNPDAQAITAFLKQKGYVADGYAMGPRPRFVHPNGISFVTVGNRTTCLYEKRGNIVGDKVRYPTSEREAIQIGIELAIAGQQKLEVIN